MAGSGGNNAQFTYDFGISIAQSTVNKISRLTGVTLTLASAFYALRSTANEYVRTLKENTLRFGGMVSTIKAMEQAQNRLIKGVSYFSMDDQLNGMEQLRRVGIDVAENIEWINKAAHATGKSYSEFSGMIASAIQGNSQALVDAGLMTQRATRIFDKYQANTLMRQQAILGFVKQHKGLAAAIRNDFVTIQDQILRIKATWKAFLQSIVGKPNDPSSLYGQVTSSMGLVAEAFSRNADLLRKYGFMIGKALGWIVKQVGHFVVWMGKQVKKALSMVWKVTDNFREQTYSFLVWLEFWKVKIVDFFKTYSSEIKFLLKLLIAYKLLKGVFVIGNAAITSIKAYKAAMLGTVALQKRYIQSMGPYIGKTAKFFQSLAVWLPAPFRKAWVWLGKFFAGFSFNMRLMRASIDKFFSGVASGAGKFFKLVLGFIKNIPAFLTAAGNGLKALWSALNATNPVGWIILAVTLLVTLYKKSEKFRVLINNIFKFYVEYLKLIWNTVVYLITWIQVGLKKLWGLFQTYIWEPIKTFFSNVWDWTTEMWSHFKDSKVGKWIDKYIVTPLKNVFQWIVDAWNWVVKGIGKAIGWLSGANDRISGATQQLAEENGVTALPTFSGGKYDTEDSTDYLTNPFKKRKISEPTETGNPILATSSGVPAMGGQSSNGNNSTTMNFDKGSIQIVVQKGENIDERLLAQRIREVISDVRRDSNVRGGMV